jgi:oxygen-independent coproporphyrinogen-3 oxidase
MAGIYIHIPFCRKACNYCDFHFSVSLKNKDHMIAMIVREAELRRSYLPEDAVIQTIYFGGGTPSLLSASELKAIIETLRNKYTVADDAEITLEANPDDLDQKKLRELADASVNRLSIGIQSFFDEDLRWMNRAHDAQSATRAVQDAQNAGFSNITIDLIYGIPTLSVERWEENLRQAFLLGVPHISAYCLTVEKNTALYKLISNGLSQDVDESQGAAHFNTMLRLMEMNGYVQYEISNFCKPGNYSRHNSNYWRREHYLGIGPSAHSFDGKSRQWNVANNGRYISAMERSEPEFTLELLSLTDQYNEYVMTTLRTIWGSDISEVMKFGEDKESYFRNGIVRYIETGHLQLKENKVFLTDSGKLIADAIAQELFIV